MVDAVGGPKGKGKVQGQDEEEGMDLKAFEQELGGAAGGEGGLDQESMKALFDAADKDKDGKISPGEMEALKKEAGGDDGKISPEEAKAFLEKKKEQQGQQGQGEGQQGQGGGGEQPGGPSGPEEKPQEGDDAKLDTAVDEFFKANDTDGQEGLSQDEWKKAGGDDESFKKADKDGKGGVSKSEAKAFAKESGGKMPSGGGGGGGGGQK